MARAHSLSYRSGVWLLLLSAFVFSSAGIFTKGVSADAWSVIFWRGLFAAGFTTLYILKKRSARDEFLSMGKPGLAVGFISAAGTIAFITAFKYTTVANVTLIYAVSPFIAAAIAWYWFREKPSGQVLIASIVALFGVLKIFSGSAVLVTGDSLIGDFLALWMTLLMSLIFVIYRRFPATPAGGPAVFSSLLLCPLCLLFGRPLAEQAHEIMIMCIFGLVFAVASVTLAEGARRVPSAEASLLSAAEIPLAIFWAFLFLAEIPARATIVGGTIVTLALVYSQRSRLKLADKPAMPR